MIVVGDSASTATADDPQRIRVPLEIPAALNRQILADNNSDRSLEIADGTTESPPATEVLQASDSRQQLSPAMPATAVELAGSEAADSADNALAPTVEIAEQVVTAFETRQPVEPFKGQQPNDVEQALLASSPDSYTLQLLGSHSEDNVKEFIASNPAADELSYFESRHQGRPWFVVVHGSYFDRSAAREAIDRLPPALRELQPWARSLSDIQSDIRGNR